MVDYIDEMLYIIRWKIAEQVMCQLRVLPALFFTPVQAFFECDYRFAQLKALPGRG
jgi:hypothetical protein